MFESLIKCMEEEGQYQLRHYEPRSILGRGAFAIVISAYDKIERVNVAIKIVEKKLFKNKEQADAIRQEAATLQTLIHRNIIAIKGFYETHSKFFIVMNQIDGETLESYITRIKSHQVIPITKQILKALCYLHEKNVVHRDIKPENILISNFNEDIHVTLIDFGLSATVDRMQENGLLHQNCGTLLYQAPEVIKKGNYTRSVDIWALGIVVYNMLHNGEHPFYENSDTRQTYTEKMKKISLNISMENASAKNFLQRTIAYLPENRLSADQCLQHPWITGEGDIHVPLTLNEIIQCQVKREQNMAKYIKCLVFLKYLPIYCSHYKTPLVQDEIEEMNSLQDNVSLAGSDISVSSNFRIRPLIVKSQTRLRNLNNESTSNSNMGDNSRHTVDMVPEVVITAGTPVSGYLQQKRQLRKSNSMNPQDLIPPLKLSTNKQQTNNIGLPPPKKIRNLKSFKFSQPANYALITEPTSTTQRQGSSGWNRIQDSPTNNRVRILQRSNFSKKPTQL